MAADEDAAVAVPAGASLLRYPERLTLFSPIGLGVLDLDDLALRAARVEGVGTLVEGLRPLPVPSAGAD